MISKEVINLYEIEIRVKYIWLEGTRHLKLLLKADIYLPTPQCSPFQPPVE